MLHIQKEPGALSLGAKQPWHEADHSPPTSDDVQKVWVYTSTPPHILKAQHLIS
jgi:hypothetical protein